MKNHAADSEVQREAYGALRAMAALEHDSVKRIADAGGVDIVVAGMLKHIDQPGEPVCRKMDVCPSFVKETASFDSKIRSSLTLSQLWQG